MVPAKETLLTAVQATNFTNYMYEVGMDGFTRKIACSLYPTATNELVDGRTKRTGLHQELHLQVRGERVQSGGALHRDGVDTSSSCLSTIESREFQEDGRKMTLVHTIPGHPNIRSVRVHKKVTMGIMGKKTSTTKRPKTSTTERIKQANMPGGTSPQASG